VNNLNNGMACGLFPLLFARVACRSPTSGSSPVCTRRWGVGRLYTGALSDRVGRKWLIVGGMLLQGAAIALIAATSGFDAWAPRLGATRNWYGDGLPGPSRRDQDVAHPIWRASSVGIYRFWRDAGFAIGAILAGVVADALGLTANVWAVAALTAISGLVVAIRMYETLPKPPGQFRKGPPERSAGPRAGTAAFTNEDRVQAHRATQRGGPAPPPVRVRLALRRVRIKSRDHSCGDVVVRPCS
jgi:MFS family permease